MNRQVQCSEGGIASCAISDDASFVALVDFQGNLHPYKLAFAPTGSLDLAELPNLPSIVPLDAATHGSFQIAFSPLFGEAGESPLLAVPSVSSSVALLSPPFNSPSPPLLVPSSQGPSHAGGVVLSVAVTNSVTMIVD